MHVIHRMRDCLFRALMNALRPIMSFLYVPTKPHVWPFLWYKYWPDLGITIEARGRMPHVLFRVIVHRKGYIEVDAFTGNSSSSMEKLEK